MHHLLFFLLYLCCSSTQVHSEPEKRRTLSFATTSISLLTEDAIPTPELQQLLDFLEIPHQNNLPSIVEVTQKSWIQMGKERWEFQPFEEDKKSDLLPIFKNIGLIDSSHASQKEYDYALVHGGFYTRVQERIDHLITQFKQGVRFKQVILLTGQRFLDPKTVERNLPFQTETEMMLFVWQNAQMPEEMRQIPYFLTDAPRQKKGNDNWVRPNTKDTLIEWLKTDPSPGLCLFISNQPFSGYQDSVARTVLPSTFSIETIGTCADPDLPVAVSLDNLARWLYQEAIRRGVNEISQ